MNNINAGNENPFLDRDPNFLAGETYQPTPSSRIVSTSSIFVSRADSSVLSDDEASLPFIGSLTFDLRVGKLSPKPIKGKKGEKKTVEFRMNALFLSKLAPSAAKSEQKEQEIPSFLKEKPVFEEDEAGLFGMDTEELPFKLDL